MTSPVPEDVPAADLKRVAEKIAGEYLRFNISCQRLYADVLQALEAERDRCARIAEAHGDTWSGSRDMSVACQESAVDAKVVVIAAAIRGTHG